MIDLGAGLEQGEHRFNHCLAAGTSVLDDRRVMVGPEPPMAARRPSAAAVGSCSALAEHTMSARSSILMVDGATSQLVRPVSARRNLQRL